MSDLVEMLRHVNLKTNKQELAYQFREIHDNVNFINIQSTPLKI